MKINWNPLTLAFSLLLLIATCSPAIGQTLKPRLETNEKLDARLRAAYDSASRSLAAFRTGDYETFANFVHAKVMDEVGGRQNMINLTKQGKVALDEQTDGYDSSVKPPKRLIATANNLFTVVPQSVTVRLKSGQEILRDSYLLGVSADNGKSWKFIDGAGGAKKLREMMPEFPRNERLPDEPAGR